MSKGIVIHKRFFLKHKICFIHPHRTGGNSIFNALGLPNIHIFVDRWIEILGMDVFRSLFSFAFVRDPWDRIASLYLWVTRNDPKRYAFPKWLKRQNFAKDPHMRSQCHMLDGPDGVTVSHVGKFETIDEDWRWIRERIGVGNEKLKILFRTQGKKSYRHMYDDWSGDKVAEVYAVDVERFGYKF